MNQHLNANPNPNPNPNPNLNPNPNPKPNPNPNPDPNPNWIGLLEPDERPPIATPPAFCAAVPGGINAYTDGFLENGIGIDDYMALCKELNMIPAITIRVQLGGSVDAEEAASWVEYMNGHPVTSLMGRLRASRGHYKAYDVKYWYLGNEINLSY